MKNMNKKIAVMLVFALASMLMVGCDKDNESSSEAVSEVSSVAVSDSETSEAAEENPGETAVSETAEASSTATSADSSSASKTSKQETKQESKAGESKSNSAASASEKKAGLTALSSEELNKLLDEIYPGDSLTQEWIDRLPAEKMYEYLGQKYHDDFNGYVRKDGKAIDESTVECTVVVELLNGENKTYKLKLKVNDNHWSVISEEEVK